MEFITAAFQRTRLWVERNGPLVPNPMVLGRGFVVPKCIHCLRCKCLGMHQCTTGTKPHAMVVRRLFDRDLGFSCIRHGDFLVLIDHDVTLES